MFTNYWLTCCIVAVGHHGKATHYFMRIDISTGCYKTACVNLGGCTDVYAENREAHGSEPELITAFTLHRRAGAGAFVTTELWKQ